MLVPRLPGPAHPRGRRGGRERRHRRGPRERSAGSLPATAPPAGCAPSSPTPRSRPCGASTRPRRPWSGPGGRGPAAGHPSGGALPVHRVQGRYAGAPAAYRQTRSCLHQYQQAAEGAIRYMTVSPEVEGVVELIAALAGQVHYRHRPLRGGLRDRPSGPLTPGRRLLHPHFQRHGAVPPAPARHHGRRAGAPDVTARPSATAGTSTPAPCGCCSGLQGLGQGGGHHRLHPGRRPARRSLQAGGQRRGGGGRRRQAGQQRRAGPAPPSPQARP